MMDRPGTVKVGSEEERAFLFLCMTRERMAVEREEARISGIENPVDFRFVLDGKVIELSYDELVSRLTMEAKREEHF